MDPAMPTSAFNVILNLARSDQSLSLSDPTTPTSNPVSIKKAYDSVPKELPQKGLGTEKTISWLLENIAQGFAAGQSGPRYFGFVTGGVLPAAQLGDFITTIYDQNVQVHLPEHSLSTLLEARTLEMVLDLLWIDRNAFKGRVITTGATASNILGLACGRDYVIKRLRPDYDVSEDGLIGAPPVKVLAERPHLSILKAAAVVGIGRSNVESINTGGKYTFVEALEEAMIRNSQGGTGMIVSVSFGEVNTGEFTPNLKKIRELCDIYGAWLHIDAAFGAFARVSSSPATRGLADGIELGDSITSDGHKWLNLPYDCGLFFSQNESDLVSVFGPSPRTGGAAYLKTHTDDGDLPSVTSPLYLGIENSRRFRALPMFCALVAMGREGYTEVVDRNIGFAKRIGKWICGQESYELLNGNEEGEVPLNVVLFRGRKEGMDLEKAINERGKIYVTGTKWEGRSAVRLAVSNWKTGLDGNEDFEAVINALESVVM
ncbi:hypothetical protein FRC02_006363 [Tulasnella sp. 418]|nr:hypothetical protein FRC02_006363 [Tulasnella sp. 418]